VNDPVERAKRVVEEALELGQAAGLTAADAADLVKYVFSRPVGDPRQEIAGVLVTTLVLAETFNVEAEGALRDELFRVNQPEVLAKIRAKQVSKEIAGIGNATGVPV
jgi:NTP pyrophosphatase (non-canonical NTP hydrolase)